MDFLRDNKGKILAAAVAAVGGLLWMQTRSKSTQDVLTQTFNQYLEKRKKLTEENTKQEAILKLKKELLQILKANVQKHQTKAEREGEYIEFFMNSFQIFYKQIKDLSDEQQQVEQLIEGYRDIIGVILQYGTMGDFIFESNEDNKFSVQECFKQMFTNGEVDEKIDTLDFIFSSLHFIREEDAVTFINSRVMIAEDLKHIFLGKMIRHSHTCLKINPKSETKLSQSDFYFSNHYFDMINDLNFLKTLQTPHLLSSLTLFNHFCTSFNKNLEFFTFKEPFLVKWQKLLQIVLFNEEYIKYLSTQKESQTLFSEIFKQLTFSLFTFTISYNLEEKQLSNYSEVFQQRLIPYCSVMIIAEECLKSMDGYLKSLKPLGLIQKLRSSFMCIIHDFMLTLVQFYQKNNCSNYLNILSQSITLMITHSHNSIPSSETIQKFWSSIYLPTDCNIDNILEPYFRMSLAQFFEVTGLSTIVEQLLQYYEEEGQRKIRIFLQIVNNKRFTFNRLRVLSYQYVILQSYFEDPEIQQSIVKQLFKTDLKDNRSISFAALNIGEKIFTPLHFINQINHETDIVSEDEREQIREQLTKYTQEGVQYLLNVFKLAGQSLNQNELLTYVKNGIYSKLTLDQIKVNLEETGDNTSVLKNDIVLNNQLELFFDRQMVFEGFKLTKLNQDVSLILYDTLDFVKEIQYRLFTKQFFIDYVIKCVFKNPMVLLQIHTQALILFELMIDFIYESLTNKTETDDPKIDNLVEKICEDTSVYESLKTDSILFVETHKHAKDLTEQLLNRIEARLAQIQKL